MAEYPATNQYASPAFLKKLQRLQVEMHDAPWEKSARNTFQKYNYIPESQYKAYYKAALRVAELLWFSETIDSTVHPFSDKQTLTTTRHRGLIIDPDSGEYIEVQFEGSGADSGDKGLYKAATGGLKYYLSNTYLVAEGNDPEETEDEPKSKFVTPEDNAATKKRLTDPKGKAQTVQIRTIRKHLERLREFDPETVDATLEDTDDLKTLTKEQATSLLELLPNMIAEHENGGASGEDD